jgi:hypothetical protein
MALAHQANSQKVRPRMAAVLGASAVGKTVYLGMLMDMLSRRPDRLQVLARGAFSITLQQTTVAALSRCEFPEKTPNEPDRWNWVHCQVRRPEHRQATELIVPDMAGESILQELDHPHSYEVIREFLKKCSGTMVLIDALKLQGGGREPDYFNMKLVSYLAEMDEGTKRGRSQKPLALVFTKADQCPPCREDPAAFAATHAAGLWQQCRERFANFRFFAAGVAGACGFRRTGNHARAHVPLRIEPHGIVEPFDWLLGQMKL